MISAPPAPAPVRVVAVQRPLAEEGFAPGLPPLTTAARRFLLALAVLFLAAVALRLHGSSVAMWTSAGNADIHPQDAPSGLLLSHPRIIRADEWSVWTPAMLNQARQEPSFPVHNPTLGPGVTPLLMSLPARHYTMIFRPALWGFFFLPFDSAFSWYWNAKVFGLCASVFLLTWTLTGGRFGLAVFGAVAVQWSPFVQWWFSTPAMLPEMISYWALGLAAALTLFAPDGGWKQRALAAGAVTWGAVGFNLCCYPAFEVPLAHVGACVLAGNVWQDRRWSWRGAAWLAGALLAAVLALVPWLLDCLPTLRIEAATIYPGQRHAYGGDMSVCQVLTGLCNLAMGQGRCPPELFNVCEAANFFPLWLLPYGLGIAAAVRAAWGKEGRWIVCLRARGVRAALCAYLAGVTVYMFVQLPPWLASATLIDRSYGRRCLLGMGIAGVLLVVLSLAARPPGGRPSSRAAWIAGGAWTMGVLTFLASCLHRFPVLFHLGNALALLAVAVFFGAAYLGGPRWLLPVGWAAVFVPMTALINPLSAGLPELLDSPTLNRLAAIVRQNPQAQWAVYNSTDGCELLKATGAHVINGLRIIPDPALVHQYGPAPQDEDKFNRYSELMLFEASDEKGLQVGLANSAFVSVRLSVRLLRERFPLVRYLASTRELHTAAGAGFALVGHLEGERLWLYALEESPAP